MLRVDNFSESQNADATHSELARLQRFGATRDRAKKILPPAPPFSCFSSRAGQHCPPRFEASVHFSPTDVETAGSTANAAPSTNLELFIAFAFHAYEKKRKEGQTKGWSSSSSELLSVFSAKKMRHEFSWGKTRRRAFSLRLRFLRECLQ